MDSEHLEDFTWIESRNAYHHDEDCIQCDECHEDIVCEDALSSEITGESYCCDKYMEKAETAFMQENWYYSEYDNKWFEEEEDITHIQVWIDTESRYKDISISTVTLDKLIEDEKAWTFDDETFDKVNPETGLPYGYEPTKKERHEYSIVEETV